jgi:MerR family transcriptional regulator, heat shock protein HspR
MMASRRRTTTRITVNADRGVFMISVAAELAEMHPQTLRMYEQRGLIEPKRSPKGTRLYSQADVEKLRRIQEMTNELGLNLAGVERVLALEEELERTTRRLQQLERRSRQMREELEAEVVRARQALRGELVPYRRADVVPARPPADAAGAAPPAPPAAERDGSGDGSARRRIPIERDDRPRDGGAPPSAS